MATSRSELLVISLSTPRHATYILVNALLLHSAITSLAEYVKTAVAEDKAEHYQEAFEAYMTALEYFKTHLKYEKNPRAKEAITLKVMLIDNCLLAILQSRP